MIDLDDKAGNGIEEPVEDEGGGDEEGVALRLHDGFLVAEVLRRGAGIGFTGGSGLVLPVDIHQEEEAEGDDREEGFEEAMGHGDQPLSERVEARESEEEEHDGFCAGGVTEDYPFQRHGCWWSVRGRERCRRNGEFVEREREQGGEPRTKEGDGGG